MSFTDEDLAKLKETTAHYRKMGSMSLMVGHGYLDTLIGRLEAAEVLLPAWQKQNGEPEARRVWLEAKKKWLKASGKGE